MRNGVSGSLIIGLAVALAFFPAPPLHAGLFGPSTKPASSDQGPGHADCDVVAAASGMDKATCESLNQTEASYYAAQHDPSGARPGDDAMTCDQIKSELASQPVSAPPSGHVASAQSATADFRTRQASMQAKVATAMTALNVAATAATAVGMANPIAGRAADTAVEAARDATEKSLNAEAKATLVPAQQKMMSSTATLMGDMMPAMENNPRLARLVQMSTDRHCRGF
jgi:hypothetical protein